MSNEVWAVHYDGKLLAEVAGSRIGAVYCLIGHAKAFKTRTGNDWKRYMDRRDSEKLSVVRYVPAEVQP